MAAFFGVMLAADTQQGMAINATNTTEHTIHRYRFIVIPSLIVLILHPI
jgi:hypothetical protein